MKLESNFLSSSKSSEASMKRAEENSDRNSITMSYRDGYFCLYDKQLKRDPSGFIWSEMDQCYKTPSHQVAHRLRVFADHKARRALSKRYIVKRVQLEEDDPRPDPPLELYEFQKRAIHFALERNRCMLGIDPGLGKTIIAAMLARYTGGNIVYITPPSLYENVLKEFRKWAPEIRIAEVRGKAFKKPASWEDIDMLLLPDSILTRMPRSSIQFFLKQRPFFENLLIVDETQRFKNPAASRSMALYGKKVKDYERPTDYGMLDLFERVVFMSGTPIENALLDLHSFLARAAGETIDFLPRLAYAKKYCGAFQRPAFQGYNRSEQKSEEVLKWDLNGRPDFEQIAALRKRVVHPHGPFMFQLKKADCGIELPSRLEQTVTISGAMKGELKALDESLGKKYNASHDLIKTLLAASMGSRDESALHVMQYRRLLGLEKVGYALNFIIEILESSAENILVFAYHKEVIEKLSAGLTQKGKPHFIITGETPVRERQGQVDRFQAGERRVFLGNYQAMGTGFTLTRADRVIFVEYSWKPGENSQAIDRAHRIGRKEPVLAQYLIYKDSLDKRIMEAVLRKRDVIEQFEKGKTA